MHFGDYEYVRRDPVEDELDAQDLLLGLLDHCHTSSVLFRYGAVFIVVII